MYIIRGSSLSNFFKL